MADMQVVIPPCITAGKIDAKKGIWALFLPESSGTLYSVSEISREVLLNPMEEVKKGNIKAIAKLEPCEITLPDGSVQFSMKPLPLPGSPLKDPKILESASNNLNAALSKYGFRGLKQYLSQDQLRGMAVSTVLLTDTVTGYDLQQAKHLADSVIAHSNKDAAYTALEKLGMKMNRAALQQSAPIKVAEEHLAPPETEDPTSLLEGDTIDVDPVK